MSVSCRRPSALQALSLLFERANFGASSISTFTRHAPTRYSRGFGHPTAGRGVLSISRPSRLRDYSTQKLVAAKGNASYRSLWSASTIGRVGNEPGGEVATTSSEPNAAPDKDSEIKIVDFAAERVTETVLQSQDLEAHLKENPKPSWAACRWIYVNGLNAAVVQGLGRAKGLHRLAIEDVLEKGTPVKADWYDGHCFMVLALQKLVHVHDKHGISDQHVERAQTFRSSTHQNRVHGRTNAKVYHFQQQQSAMEVEHAFMFLTSDNTVVTIFEHSGQDVFSPIMTRLQSAQTMMRSSNDPSMLVQAVIDVVVDLSIPIGKAVGDAFSELEEAVLTQPAISQSTQLYVLRSGLTILMDNVSANGSVVRELIGHRSVVNAEGKTGQSPSGAHLASANTTISPMTQIYLQDVLDHIRTMSNSTHMSIRSAENLTSLIFNTIAASQNESVRQLTLISSFFLPLTFLTGYFGMNFDPMPVVNEHSDMFFWYIATPLILGMGGVLLSRTMWVRLRTRAWKGKRRPQR